MRRARLYRAIVLATAPPLALASIALLVSGYCIAKTSIVSRALHLDLDYTLCLSVHTSPVLRLLAIALALAHGGAGFALLALRSRMAKLMEPLILAVVLLLALLLVLIEIA